MTDSIFLLSEDGSLRALERQGYVSEDRLQALLALYPQLLAGEQMDLEEPRRWLLVSRELGIPSNEDGSSRWAVDHLFLDQDAIPTLVEVKRSSDTRLRREVVGQLLEYAANAVSYWTPAFVRDRFEEACRTAGTQPQDELTAILGSDRDYESYWDLVKTNLQAGRIRLLFVADEIPKELRQIVEFLNEQMDPAQVLAVEIKRYSGEGVSTLVPRVLGHTATAQQTKGSTRPKRKWNEDTFFGAMAETASQELPVARKIFEWARARNLDVWFGEGATMGSFSPRKVVDNQKHQLFAVWTGGWVEIYFYWHASKAPFSDEVLRQEMLNRLNDIDGVDLPPDSIHRRPSFSLAALRGDSAFQKFSDVFDWYLELVHKASSPGSN